LLFFILAGILSLISNAGVLEIRQVKVEEIPPGIWKNVQAVIG